MSTLVYRVFISPAIGENVNLSRPTAIFTSKHDAIDYAIYMGECTGGSTPVVDEFDLFDNDGHRRVWDQGFSTDNRVTMSGFL